MNDDVLNHDILDSDEIQLEQSLRPTQLDQYIGQTQLKARLSVYIQAAKQREEPLDHVLLYGPPGLGKTTLAAVIANEMVVNFRTTTGPVIEKQGDLLAILNELAPGDVLFIDEIHRLPRNVEEMLYSAMEDYYVDIIVGDGESSRPVRFPLPPFTLIGATTRGGMLSQPLRDRFGIVEHMNYYTEQELADIIKRSAKIFAMTITDTGAIELARRSHGTPRIANRLLRRVRDFAMVQNKDVVDIDLVNYALNLLKIDSAGLDQVDQKILLTMINYYHGGPVGVKTMAANIGEEIDTIESMYEPYLLQIGFLQRTPRGRVVTPAAYQHLQIPIDKEEGEK
ncbi:Holliday junction branch migration DNA helicase RuvB [Weissella diestrammenae]|uniref:Holliday junction branch migration complex subunit RuvB n=2 Tax=Weissella diestrammenae TaxID=1162633 RepID=A0A7G9T7Q9_9LACO|nr:Holliday junction branch migration DNA helicase RuvB [Weissella diestrammenae]MCM0582882.1 Holliday junction branch migration DNA helicase RuvB [Weissella diestrammenae]QNN76134.1 Holliday junction branch migration DNA helicase RuvB [Weissella diestrammenae]